MAKPLHQRVLETIRRHRMFAPGAAVGVAVSGGADSVALLLLLEELASELGIRLSVVHFNHQLRGRDSEADEAFVRQLADTHKLEWIAGGADVAARSQGEGWNLEDAGRRLRYAFFAELVEQRRVNCVAVAHTKDDQAETVLAHAIRGTGPAGLAGIHPVAGNVVRPLLGVRRTELREFLTSKQQQWREDSTNADETRLRSRIRHRLIPYLAADFQPAIVGHLSQLAGLAREDEAFWQAFIEERFRTLVHRQKEHVVIGITSLLCPVGDLLNSPDASLPVSKRLVRRILAELKGTTQGFTARHVEDVLALAQTSQSGCHLRLPAGVVVERVFDEIAFSRAPTAVLDNAVRGIVGQSSFRYPIPLEGSAVSIDVRETGTRLGLKVFDWPDGSRETILYALDRDLLRSPLEFRNWEPGDAYRPQGRLRQRKLKQMLRERRVGLRDRAHWPVLTSGGSVVWVRGFPFAAEFAASAKTRVGVIVTEEPL